MNKSRNIISFLFVMILVVITVDMTHGFRTVSLQQSNNINGGVYAHRSSTTTTTTTGSSSSKTRLYMTTSSNKSPKGSSSSNSSNNNNNESTTTGKKKTKTKVRRRRRVKRVKRKVSKEPPTMKQRLQKVTTKVKQQRKEKEDKDKEEYELIEGDDGIMYLHRILDKEDGENEEENDEEEEEEEDDFITARAKARAAAAAAKEAEEDDHDEDELDENGVPIKAITTDEFDEYKEELGLLEDGEDFEELTLRFNKTIADLFVKKMKLEGMGSPIFGSMYDLLDHNKKMGQSRRKRQAKRKQDAVHRVMIVMGKALEDHQVTVEYAARIQTLARLVLLSTNDDDPEVDDDPISLICFCGGSSTRVGGKSPVAISDAGLIYFRHLCAAQEIDCVSDIPMYCDRTSVNEIQAINNVVRLMNSKYIPQWLEDSKDTLMIQDEFEPGVFHKKKRIHIHFSLVSSDYHLCNLNDIHYRSPESDLLRPLRVGLVDQVTKDSNKAGRIETSWEYAYAVYPYRAWSIPTSSRTMKFLGECYTLSEELLPLYVNLRNIVDDKEFFQQDNYLECTRIRQTLVMKMENLHEDHIKHMAEIRHQLSIMTADDYERPSSLKKKKELEEEVKKQKELKEEMKKKKKKKDLTFVDVLLLKTLDEILEDATLHVGRAQEILRPAGLLENSLTKDECLKALRYLDYAMLHIRKYCDPDQPLPASEWGKLYLGLQVKEDMELTDDELELLRSPTVLEWDLFRDQTPDEDLDVIEQELERRRDEGLPIQEVPKGFFDLNDPDQVSDLKAIEKVLKQKAKEEADKKRQRG